MRQPTRVTGSLRSQLDLRMMAIGPVRGALNVVLNVNLKNIDTARVQSMYEGGGKVCSGKCDSR